MEKEGLRPAAFSAVLGKGWTVSGVTAVISGTDKEAVLRTGGGTLKMRGEKFNITKVDLEAGVVEVQGNLQSMTCSGGKGPLLKRLLR